MKASRLLVVDDEEFIRLNIAKIFAGEVYQVSAAASGEEALTTLRNSEIDLALLDLDLPDIHGIELLKQMREIQPDLLVIIVTGYASVESAVEAIKAGAYDYIKKPFKADAIKLITRLALETHSLRKKVERLEAQQPSQKTGEQLGNSPQIVEIRDQIREFARHKSATVLITGESGTGKELVAQSIHRLTPENRGEFVEINCASIPENLLESELFGHEKGAFTDARERKIGLLEKADGGTLFLDEIGEMSLGLQAKLLRVLEDGKFRRLGSTQPLEVNIRVIAATNKNLAEAIRDKEFREDLYYRLNVLRLHLPPLRERGDDVLILADHFLALFKSKFNKQITGFSEGAKNRLRQYNWPGNVRELRNIIERLVILQKTPVVGVEHLPGELQGHLPVSSQNDSPKDFYLGERSLDEMLNETEIAILSKAYHLCGGNTSKTARLLKIPRETLRYKLEKYQIVSG